MRLHIFGIAVILASFLGPCLSAEEKEAKAKTGAAVYEEFKYPWREKFVKGWEQEVEQVKKNIKEYQRRSHAARNIRDRQDNVKQLKKEKERLLLLQKNDPPFVGGGCSGVFTEWEIGFYGVTGYTPYVFQVIGDKQVLVGSEDAGPLILLNMNSNAGIVDGKLLNFGDDFIHVTGTTTYTTILGATKTVLAADVLNLDSLKKKD